MATAITLRTPLGRRVKVVEQGAGTPVVFLHSGVGSAREWKQVFSLWPEGYQLVAIEAYRDGTGPGEGGRPSLDDYADQVHAVAEHLGRLSVWSGSRGAAQQPCGWRLDARAGHLARRHRA
jgi:lipase